MQCSNQPSDESHECKLSCMVLCGWIIIKSQNLDEIINMLSGHTLGELILPCFENIWQTEMYSWRVLSPLLDEITHLFSLTGNSLTYLKRNLMEQETQTVWQISYQTFSFMGDHFWTALLSVYQHRSMNTHRYNSYILCNISHHRSTSDLFAVYQLFVILCSWRRV